MELSIYEAVKAIQDAIKYGYTPELLINGQYYEIKQNNNYEVVCYEVIKANGGKENV
ncbi:MAG: hypothetical protein II669_04595 [Elusimicrobia bacterium]|nr:hypothetical protein [Elusimicrobiota bacterium]